MGNRAPVARDFDRETVNDLTEATQVFVRDQKALSSKRARLHRVVARLRVANKIEEEQAKAAVESATENLRRVREINAAEDEVWRELLEVDGDDERSIQAAEEELGSLAARAGSTIVDPELLRPKGMVARRKQLRDNGEITRDEASAI